MHTKPETFRRGGHHRPDLVLRATLEQCVDKSAKEVSQGNTDQDIGRKMLFCLNPRPPRRVRQRYQGAFEAERAPSWEWIILDVS